MKTLVNAEKWLEELYTQYNDFLTKIAMHRMEHKQNAQDCVGEVFLLAVMKADELAVHPNKIAWLVRALDFMIKKNQTLHTRRKTSVDSNGKTVTEYEYIQLLPIDEMETMLSSESYADEDGLFSAYQDILTEQEILYLIYRFEYALSTNEIARRLQKTESATTTFGYRIRKKIQKHLGRGRSHGQAGE